MPVIDDADMIFDIETAAAWQAKMIAEGHLPWWVISRNTIDHPGVFSARAWTAPAHGLGTDVDALYYRAVLIAPTLEAIRGLIPPGLYRSPRQPLDDAFVVERWS